MSHAGRISTVGTGAPSARRPALPRLVRCVAASVVALLLASSAASAEAADPVSEQKGRGGSVDYSQLPAYPRALTGRENQATASSGTEASAPATGQTSDAPGGQSIDAGFDWDSAAIGAAGAAGLIALGSLGLMAAGGRNRVRTAR